MMMDKALNTPGIKTVIFSTAAKLQDENADGKAAIAALQDTLKQFVATGHEVIWINDTPMLDFEPRACIGRAGIASSQNAQRLCAGA